ncbi:MAG TPA: hypothetical protein VKX41_17835 [Alloacidobacterium sp.]|nr:hypothetical protein [Alloacidobacterium sp.]
MYIPLLLGSDIIHGDRTIFPVGKLPVSFPRSVGQEPLSYMQFPTGRPWTNVDLSHPPATGREKDVSRYIDEDNAPLFPFGWGLSYSKFSFRDPVVSRSIVSLSELVSDSSTTQQPQQAGVDVHNDGSMEAIETVQLYIGKRSSSVEQPMAS